MSSSLPPRRSSSSFPLRRHSWDAVNETQAMLEGSSSPPLPSAVDGSLSSSSSTQIAAEHESLDDILAKARRSTSAGAAVNKSSPLNPNSTPRRPSSSYISHRASFTHVLRIPSEESRALSTHIPSASSSRPSTPSSLSCPAVNNASNSSLRGSMILYRLAADELRAPSRTSSEHGRLVPPRVRNSYHGASRNSTISMSAMSISGDSFVSLSSDSKYPISGSGSDRGLVPYAYEPDETDHSLFDDEDDGEDWSFEDEYNESKWNEKKRLSAVPSNAAHTPTVPKEQTRSPLNRRNLYSSRGIINALGLILLLVGLLALFLIYPVATFYHDNGRNHRITINSRINATGQAEGDGGDVAPTGDNHRGHEIVDRRDMWTFDNSPETNHRWNLIFRFISTDLPSSTETDSKRRMSSRFARHHD
ncbi:hypothetical protein E1B28_009851 [Marasmius oreades]|uniref:Uncharacterized protein n=1 Tax=Marasmius oreades TaxID=181124 RepID=A0A9P7US42_9AGAR|nr:uncharacterized protein E1B28_009851 [Marasmius oreades]KAG7090766.1 hypothetical protein E1B28_009851 [Marasmius oreades]